MEDGHFIDDPLAVAGAKPDFSGMGLKKKPLYKEPEDAKLFWVVRKLIELDAEFDIKACGLHITNKSNE